MTDRDFLERLVIAARTYGHMGDYVAVVDFVKWVHHEYGMICPKNEQLEPYPIEENE